MIKKHNLKYDTFKDLIIYEGRGCKRNSWSRRKLIEEIGKANRIATL